MADIACFINEIRYLEPDLGLGLAPIGGRSPLIGEFGEFDR
jgi:hypothetical protein